MTRVVLVIPSMGPGGAERVMKILGAWLVKMGYHTTLITIIGDQEQDFYKLKVNQRFALNLGSSSGSIFKALVNNMRILVRLRRAIRSASPDVVISFLAETNVLSYLATRLMKVRLVVSEHTDPDLGKPKLVWDVLRRICYPRCDTVVAPTNYIKQRLENIFPIRAETIPNPVLGTGYRKQPRSTDHKPSVLITIGRMTKEKNHVLLLDAFSLVTKECPESKLIIVGDGPCRAETMTHADRIGVKEQVEFPGLIQDPWREYADRAEIFVLSSSYEGFPMALCEAMASGLAVVSTKYNRGVEEIVTHGFSGLLVPPDDAKALANAIVRLIKTPVLRKNLGNKATEISTRYGEEATMGSWMNLIDKLSYQSVEATASD